MLLPALGGCGQPQPSEPENNGYSNPVYEPVFADPCVIAYEGKYYAYATEDYGEWKPSDDPLENVSNKKVVPILESEDLVHWYFKNGAFTDLKKPSWGTYGSNVWAPDVVQIGDTFVMYYALSVWGDPDPGIGIATASHPLGPWTDKGKLFTSNEIGVNNSIDPAVFRGQDNKLYMIWGSFRGLYGVELTDDGLGLKGGVEGAKESKVRVAGLDTSTPWNGGTYEAPYIIYENGYYYMFASSGTCCEGLASTSHVRVARSRDPLGPYVGSDGVDMLGTERGDIVVQAGADFVGVGHNAVIKDGKGDWYLLYHGFDTKEHGMYGNSNRRTLLLSKLEWQNGFPYVEGKVAGRNDLVLPSVKN